MSASDLSVITIAFPDPKQPEREAGVYDDLDPAQSFEWPTQSKVRTLSTNGAPNVDSVRGLLYVPDLMTDTCKNATADLVPGNVTRRANLPDTDYILIGFAPWIEQECVLEYLDATRNSPIHGFIFYIPGNSTEIPPMMNDPVWGLGDGASWKRDNNFPVWAIPGTSGAIIMDQLGRYSGNVTEVPHGHDLASIYPASEYIRLYGIMRLNDRNSLPSLWVFLLITLGLLIFFIGITTVILQLLNRRRRRILRERIVNGEVDLEALGIKRLTVPQEILDKMPTYVYNTEVAPSQARETGAGPILPSSTSSTDFTQAAFSQPTCAICLDDFESSETTVRELPCRHIFHPECVDMFLLNNSSLCPMCKHSTLPQGYCPSVITNAMVRRECMVRRHRERAERRAADATASGATPPLDGTASSHFREEEIHTGRRAAMRRAFTSIIGRRRLPPQQRSSDNDIEMAPAHTPVATPAPVHDPDRLEVPMNNTATPATYREPCPGGVPENQSRRDWAYRRAVALFERRSPGERRTPIVDADEEEQRRGPVRRFFGRVFPT